MGQSDQGLRSGKKRYQVIPRVLIFLRNMSEVLLLKGAPDKRIWANRYNGVGGHIEVDEDVFTAARREVREETGLEVADLHLRAVVNIDAGDDELGILMFAFVGWTPQRETIASNEGQLHWVPADNLPAAELVEDLTWLLPQILKMDQDTPPLFLRYCYDSDDRLVIRQAGAQPIRIGS